MAATEHTTLGKYATTIGVIVLAAIALVGAAYAYNAIYNDDFNGDESEEKYTLITGDLADLTTKSIKAQWDTTSTKATTGPSNAVYSNGTFVINDEDDQTEGIQLVYALGTITVTTYTDGTPSAYTGLTADMFSLTAKTLSDGDKNAVSGTPTIILTQGKTDDKDNGVYTVSMKVTLVTLGNNYDNDVNKNYVVPGYNVTIKIPNLS